MSDVAYYEPRGPEPYQVSFNQLATLRTGFISTRFFVDLWPFSIAPCERVMPLSVQKLLWTVPTRC